MLTEVPARHATVDRCPDCGGLWIDWFDGEIASVASAVPPAPAAARAAPGETGRGCPDCRAELVPTRYPDDKSGAELLRCGGCAGAFVPRASLQMVIALGPPGDRPREPRSRIAELLAELQRLVFGS